MLGRPCKLIFMSEDRVAGVPEAKMMKALNEGTEVVTPLQEGDGEPHGFLKILRDRTEQKREEEQRQLLLAELDHRAKNTLAIVQSLVSQAARRATTPEALREAPAGRLDAPWRSPMTCSHPRGLARREGRRCRAGDARAV